MMQYEDAKKMRENWPVLEMRRKETLFQPCVRTVGLVISGELVRLNVCIHRTFPNS